MARDHKCKCRHCKEFFTPDNRNRGRQRYCSRPPCRLASKQAAQRKWRQGKGREYFKGPVNAKRVRLWRARHPDYSTRKKLKAKDTLQDSSIRQTVAGTTVKPAYPEGAIQDLLNSQTYMVIGLIQHLVGDTEIALQDSTEDLIRALISRGQRLHEQGFRFSRLLGGSFHEHQASAVP